MKIDEIIKQIQKREIKFRGKRKDNGEWVYGNLVGLREDGIKKYFVIPNFYDILEISGIRDGSDTNPVVELEKLFFEVTPRTIGQYTGLKDKNGTEIYEGDIVRDNNGAIWVITYSDGAFWRGVPSLDNRGGIMPVYLLYDGEDFEIIGNIFENPELLKGEDDEDC